MMNKRVAAALALSLGLVVGGCEHTVALHDGTVTKRISANNELDILFVIDNSSSTADKQAVFAANLATFAAALDAFPGGRPNLHVGVVSTTVDLGVAGESGCPSPNPIEDGRLQNTPRVAGCVAPTDRYVSDIANPDGSRTSNYSGALADTLACIGQLGDTGCGYEAPLEAIKRALDGSRPENAGFLRPEADLAIVILTDEDDASVRDPPLFSLPASQAGPGDFRAQPLFAYTCDQPIDPASPGSYTGCHARTDSYLTPPADYVSFLASIKDPSQTVFAVIGGDPSSEISTGPLVVDGLTQSLALLPSCTATIAGDEAIGRPGIRLSEVSRAFADHGVFDSVCQADYSGALTQIGKTLFTMMAPCLDGSVAPVDLDPHNPGVQPNCVVTDKLHFGTPHEQDTVLPGCEMATPTSPVPAGVRPCWWVEPDSATCGAGASDLVIHVERTVTPPPDSVVDVVCALS